MRRPHKEIDCRFNKESFHVGYVDSHSGYPGLQRVKASVFLASKHLGQCTSEWCFLDVDIEVAGSYNPTVPSVEPQVHSEFHSFQNIYISGPSVQCDQRVSLLQDVGDTEVDGIDGNSITFLQSSSEVNEPQACIDPDGQFEICSNGHCSFIYDISPMHSGVVCESFCNIDNHMNSYNTDNISDIYTKVIRVSNEFCQCLQNSCVKCGLSGSCDSFVTCVASIESFQFKAEPQMSHTCNTSCSVIECIESYGPLDVVSTDQYYHSNVVSDSHLHTSCLHDISCSRGDNLLDVHIGCSDPNLSVVYLNDLITTFDSNLCKRNGKGGVDDSLTCISELDSSGSGSQDGLETPHKPQLHQQWGFIPDVFYKAIEGHDTRLVCNSEVHLNEWLVDAHFKVKVFQTPNYVGAWIPVLSQLNVKMWRHLLRDYKFSRVLDYIEFGFRVSLDIKGFVPQLDVNVNHSSALAFPRDLSKYFEVETSLQAMGGPFGKSPFENLHFSPLMSRPKPDGTRRVIVDLSWPQGGGVNTYISDGVYDEVVFQLKYPTIDHIVQKIQSLGPTAKHC